jgi:hypothetical protein
MALVKFGVEIVRHAFELLLNCCCLSSYDSDDLLLSLLFNFDVEVVNFGVDCICDVLEACI